MNYSGEAKTAEDKAFQKLIEGKKVLIADPGGASRTGIFKIFHDLGVKTSNLIMVNTFGQAQSLIETEKPSIVVAEYEFGKRCGLELFLYQRQKKTEENKDQIFLIITSNSSQSAVARSAEEEIDAFILKPFTVGSVRKLIIRTVVSKLQPSPYYVEIDEGKKFLAEGKFKEAEEKFTQAMEHDPSPALACYYLGYLKYLQKTLEKAKGKYAQGLEYNKIHYKCMVGFFDLLMGQKEYEKAYDIVQKLSRYFPANPKRLSEVLRLAIINQKYEDIEKYYSIFSNIEERDEELIKYVCAAMVVCGKYYLSTKVSNIRALELFKKAAATGQGRTNIIKEMILSLLEANLVNDAKAFLKRFPAESQKGEDYLLCQFLIMNKDGTSLSMVISQGRTLLNMPLVNEHLYAVMIERSLESKLTEAADSLIHEAVKKIPHKKSLFETYYTALDAMNDERNRNKKADH